MGTTHTGVEEEHNEEGAEETCYGLTPNPSSTSAVPCSAWQEGRGAAKAAVEYFGLGQEGR